MRHKNKIKKFGREKAPREMMLRNLAASILIFEKVKTTEIKAKTVRPLVEKSITLAKKGDLTARRRLIQILPQPKAVKKAMEVLFRRYADRQSGFTRIVKTGGRQGAGAKMARTKIVYYS